jgi:sulfhydrogenase subunit beta (sulfur reductase)
LKPFNYLLDKRDLAVFLEALLPLYGPVGEAEKSRFDLLREAADLGRLNLSLVNTCLPPKTLVFPQTETIITYDRQGLEERPSPAVGSENGRLVAFGVRPCDGRAFDALDSHFIDYMADPNYKLRREGAVLVGLACTEPGPNCFCTSVGGGPFSTTGLDALATDLGDALLIEVLTDRGLDLLQGKKMLTPATEAALKRRRELERKAAQGFERSFDVDGVKERLEEEADEALWNEVASRCISCGVCAYFCPTCYCFIVYNDEQRGNGQRVRTWTSCQFPKFIFQATGVNLRPTRASRFKRRVWDKYKEFPDRFGKLACMGCGRCIDSCPMDLDIVEVIKALQGQGRELLAPVFAAGEAAPELVPAKERTKAQK